MPAALISIFDPIFISLPFPTQVATNKRDDNAGYLQLTNLYAQHRNFGSASAETTANEYHIREKHQLIMNNRRLG